MLLFTRGRTPALPRSRDAGSWLAAAQSAAQSAAKSVDPGAVLEQAKADVADVARHIRSTAPDIADDLSGKPAEIRKTVLAAIPTRRRRRSRWPLVVGGVVAAGLLILATQLLMRRRSFLPMRVSDRWNPGSASAGDGMHSPTGMTPDVTTRSETLDRDASLRAADEGMGPAEQRTLDGSLDAAATSGANGELPAKLAGTDSPESAPSSL